MTETRFTGPFPLEALLLAVFPLLLLIEFFAYVLHARLYLGHWPYYNHHRHSYRGVCGPAYVYAD